MDAIASGKGDRRAVLDETRRIFGTGKPLDLVLFDTDRIASYVFESSRPPVITGASTILREINEHIAEAQYERFVIFSGGGEGMLLLPAGRGREICQEIKRVYASKTENALSVTTGFLPVGPHDFISSTEEKDPAGGVRLVSGTQAVLSRLRDQIRSEKDERGPTPERVAGDSKRCVSCRDRAGGEHSIRDLRRDAPVDGLLCDPCFHRWNVGRKEIQGISFEELVEAAGPKRAKSKYIGFLYADGNSMGALFGRLSSMAQIRFLSQAVRRVFEGLHSRVKGAVREFAPGRKDLDLPVVSYLGGGDEAIWILPGALAVDVAGRLSSWMEEESKAITGLPELLFNWTKSSYVTFGAGLVLCGYSYPVRYQFSLAKELQKSAKAMFYRAPGRAISSIDFEVLTEGSPLSEKLESARALTDRTEDPDFRRSCRPYTAEGFSLLLDKMRSLQHVRLATSQLYTLQEGSREGRRVFLNFLRYQIARKPAGEKYQDWLKAFGVKPSDPAAVESFFVHNFAQGSGTWISDGLQLAPFLGWREG